MIYHMLPATDWQNQPIDEPYVCDSLKSEGFIHCTREKERLVWVANHFYEDAPGDFVILYIDETVVESEVRWEEADNHIFPHIYGPLNCDAVVDAVNFPRESNGTFITPREWDVL